MRLPKIARQKPRCPCCRSAPALEGRCCEMGSSEGPSWRDLREGELSLKPRFSLSLRARALRTATAAAALQIGHVKHGATTPCLAARVASCPTRRTMGLPCSEGRAGRGAGAIGSRWRQAGASFRLWAPILFAKQSHLPIEFDTKLFKAYEPHLHLKKKTVAGAGPSR